MADNFKDKIRRRCPWAFNIFIFTCAFIIMFCPSLSIYADTITLKTGGIIKGLITQEKDSEIIVEIGIGSAVIKKDQILKIDRDPNYFRESVKKRPEGEDNKESVKVREENADKLYHQAEEEYGKIKALKWDFGNLAKYNKVALSYTFIGFRQFYVNLKTEI